MVQQHGLEQSLWRRGGLHHSLHGCQKHLSPQCYSCYLCVRGLVRGLLLSVIIFFGILVKAKIIHASIKCFVFKFIPLLPESWLLLLESVEVIR